MNRTRLFIRSKGVLLCQNTLLRPSISKKKGNPWEARRNWGDQLTGILMRRIKGKWEVTVVVDHVNLKIKDGEFSSILGPDGACKTTLIRAPDVSPVS